LIIGRSAAMQQVMQQVQLVAPRETTVLLLGETGTGKEEIAKTIRHLSRRRRMPMISVNCAGVPATLLEDEFFGHERGAFTDARSARAGRFEQAHRGTLLLDEIGELPLELQPKLLRALQEKEVYRIGGSSPVSLDVRIIAATNADLWGRVKDERFRDDLYYRLSVFPIHLPPLRERREDIPALAQHFVDRLCQREDSPAKFLTPAAEAELMRRTWRGNIRELQNVVEMAFIRAQSRPELEVADFQEVRPRPKSEAQEMPDPGFDFKALTARYERELIQRALARTRGNRNRAAQLLSLKRTTLIEKIRRLGIGQF
jgi:formate hydrogenlyase transcriptional activator